MARFKRGAKSAAIREYLEANPGAMPKEVVAALKKKGLKVSAQMVSVLKGKANGGGRRGRRVGNLNVDSLIQAKKLVDQLGGIEKAQDALAILAKLA
jgi:hypothetical protein